jgi:hypothetical protein
MVPYAGRLLAYVTGWINQPLLLQQCKYLAVANRDSARISPDADCPIQSGYIEQVIDVLDLVVVQLALCLLRRCL